MLLGSPARAFAVVFIHLGQFLHPYQRGAQGPRRGAEGLAFHGDPSLQLPDERHAVPEARVAQQPPCQGPEVPAPPEVPAAAAELHGPQDVEGK